MKNTVKFFVYNFLFLSGLFLFSCTGNKDSESNNDKTIKVDSSATGGAQTIEKGVAKGEAEVTTSGGQGTMPKDMEGNISFTANDASFDCKYIDPLSMSVSHLDIKKDGSYSMIRLERGSTEQLTEKISLLIINYDPEKMTLPYKVFPAAGKQAVLQYDVKISGIYISYLAKDNFELTITAFKDDIIEGTFAGVVTNSAGKGVQIKNGKFKAKLKRAQLPA